MELTATSCDDGYKKGLDNFMKEMHSINGISRSMSNMSPNSRWGGGGREQKMCVSGVGGLLL